jgi:RNA polymerase sigma factor (sigma-70 family)
MASCDRTDNQLLSAFLNGDEQAFELLIERHAGMVAGVCRRILVADIDDAVQAVFLTLAHKAAELSKHPSIAGWLHRVAWHVAQRARLAAANRKRLEREAVTVPTCDSPAGQWDDLLPHLDRELAALPERYRLPLVLHHFEGRTKQEIAALLRRPDSTISMSLLRGRDLLRRRLARHGCAITAVALGVAMNGTASAAVTVSGASIAHAATLMSAGAVATDVSSLALKLSHGAIKQMSMIKTAKLAGVAALLMVTCGAGLNLLRAATDDIAMNKDTKPVHSQATSAQDVTHADPISHIRQLDIVSMRVKNWQAAVTWYQAKLGLVPGAMHGDPFCFMSFPEGGAVLALDGTNPAIPGSSNCVPTIHVFDLPMTVRILKGRDVKIIDEPAADEGYRLARIEDGEGNLINLYDYGPTDVKPPVENVAEGALQPSAQSSESAATVLSVTNVPEARKYYVDVLGFKEDEVYGDDYAILSLQRTKIHLASNLDMLGNLAAKPDRVGKGSIYFSVSNVDELFTAMVERGALVIQSPKDQPYDERDFFVRDSDGNQFGFGQSLSESKIEKLSSPTDPAASVAELVTKISELEERIVREKHELAALRKSAPRKPISNHTMITSDGKTTTLAALFGDKRELWLINNMGHTCPYCTLWADGFNGLAKQLETRAAFVVGSPDTPEKQRSFAEERGWSFRMVSLADNPLLLELGAKDFAQGYDSPAVFVFQRTPDDHIELVSQAAFNPDDNYCTAYDLLDLLPDGAGDWAPSSERTRRR